MGLLMKLFNLLHTVTLIAIAIFVTGCQCKPQVVGVETDMSGSTGSDGLVDDIYLAYTDGSRKYLTSDKQMQRVGIFSPDNCYVEFHQRRDSNNDGKVWWDDNTQEVVLNLKNNRQTILVEGSSNAGGASWHPRELRLAIISGPSGEKQMYIVDAITTQKKSIASDAGSWPCWSPNGEWIAFYDDKSRVCIIRPDGSDRQTLSKRVGNGWSLQWTFNGTLIFVVDDGRDWKSYVPLRGTVEPFDRLNEMPEFVDQSRFGWGKSIAEANQHAASSMKQSEKRK